MAKGVYEVWRVGIGVDDGAGIAVMTSVRMALVEDGGALNGRGAVGFCRR